MKVTNINEIYRLCKLSEKDFLKHLYTKLDEKEAQTIRKTVSQLPRKNKVMVFKNNVLSSYNNKVTDYLDKITEKVCKVYCSIEIFTKSEVEEIANLIQESIELALDPTFITFVIRFVLRKICKCKQGNKKELRFVRNHEVQYRITRVYGKAKFFKSR